MGRDRASSRVASSLVAGGLGAAAAAGTYAVASYLVYDALSRASGRGWERDLPNTPGRYAVPAGFDQAVADANRMPDPEDVELDPRDATTPGLVLRGWWIPAADPDAPAVVVVHGIRSCRREANVLAPAGMLHRHGYSVLLPDLRNHGESDAGNRRYAAGTMEYRDILGAWDWLRARGIPAGRIGIVGVSFGAVSALIAGGEDPRVAAVWADSSWANIHPVLHRYLARDDRPRFLAPGALAVARLLTGIDHTAPSPDRAVTRYAGRALAIVHGGSDFDLPPDHAHSLRAAAEHAGVGLREFWIAPGAGHTEAVYLWPAAYEARLAQFFDAAIGAGAPGLPVPGEIATVRIPLRATGRSFSRGHRS
jgi:dipeptidyl aminopeptidase/acylaminoacyl peptidase